jgi:hypothetical protein
MLENLVNGKKGKKNIRVEEARKLLEIPEYIYADEKTYSKNPIDILEYRKKLAESILLIQKEIR